MSWNEYLKRTANYTPRPLLQRALPLATPKGKALDLGAGALNDARFLAENGFTVDAVDSNPEVRSYLPENAPITLTISKIEDFDYPNAAYDLINAQFSLPFVAPERFTNTFQEIIASLAPGGIFCGQFFGPEDDWSDDTAMSFHTEEEIRELLSSIEIVSLEESKKSAKTAAGKDKFWHIFDVIAERH
jgi:SAM-dependent methyltransferase